jgi:hypothetical protein
MSCKTSLRDFSRALCLSFSTFLTIHNEGQVKIYVSSHLPPVTSAFESSSSVLSPIFVGWTLNIPLIIKV